MSSIKLQTSVSTAAPTGPKEVIRRWLNLSRIEDNLKEDILRRNSDKLKDYSCKGRCGKGQDRELPEGKYWWINYEGPRCFCDKECVIIKDCCYDYKQSCPHLTSGTTEIGDESRTPTQCKFQMQQKKRLGFVITNSCSLSSRDSQTEKLCSKVDQFNRTDILKSVPTLDLTSNTSYGSVFCAACNERTNLLMWRVKAACSRTLPEETPQSELIKFVSTCEVSYSPPTELSSSMSRFRVCVPRLHDKHYAAVNDSTDAQQLKKECDSYAFPICVITPVYGVYHWFKNPHCLLLQGVFDMSLAKRVCPSSTPPLPPLTILFDFRSTGSYEISRQLKSENKPKRIHTEKQVQCKADHVFDAFTGQCRRVYGKENQCDLMKLKQSEFKALENGFLWFRGTYLFANQSQYFNINGTIFVCVNLTQNYTMLESRSTQTNASYTITVMSLTGCALSLLSLLLLIVSYLILPDLRNLPGKIILSIAVSMFMYLVLFFFVNRNENQTICSAIAVLLHFSFLSMFFWMNVMAFDIHGTFTRKGNADLNQRSSGCCTGIYLKYALYAWLVPLLIVSVSATLDITHVYNIYIGYESRSHQYCYINNLDAKLYTLVIPVGLILIYNCIALGHTVLHIRKVRKQTSTVANYSQQPGLPVICIKMTSVMGLSWILGYFAAFPHTAFLWYPYVVLNSLQGFLVFISYVLNKRVLKMYRGIFREMRGKQSSVVNKRSTNITPAP